MLEFKEDKAIMEKESTRTMEMESTSHSITATSHSITPKDSNTHSSTTEIPITEKPVPQYGWVCPLCGRANAPFVRSCDCAGMPNTILGDLGIGGLIGYKYNFNTGETANDKHNYVGETANDTLTSQPISPNDTLLEQNIMERKKNKYGN